MNAYSIEHGRTLKKHELINILKLNQNAYASGHFAKLKPIIKFTTLKIINECNKFIEYGNDNKISDDEYSDPNYKDINNMDCVIKLHNTSVYYVTKNVAIPAQILTYMVNTMKKQRKRHLKRIQIVRQKYGIYGDMLVVISLILKIGYYYI